MNLYFSCGFYLGISFYEVFKHKSQRKMDFEKKFVFQKIWRGVNFNYFLILNNILCSKNHKGNGL
jgi:hypothetical protein